MLSALIVPPRKINIAAVLLILAYRTSHESRTEHPLILDVVNIIIAVEVHYQTTHHGIVLEVNHTREYVPYLVCGKGVKPGVDLGTRLCFGTIAQTVCEYLGVDASSLDGHSVLQEILK